MPSLRVRRNSSGPRRGTVVTAICLVWVACIMALSLRAQTFQVIHNFAGGADGSMPFAGLTIDAAGNLYGTTATGGETTGQPCSDAWGARGCGTVFELSPSGSGWVLKSLYWFRWVNAFPDGVRPKGKVVFGPDGALYGTTYFGGNSFGGCGNDESYTCGTVFKLTPTPAGHWNESMVYEFPSKPGPIGLPEGSNPAAGVTFDAAGKIYGTNDGRDPGIFQLSPLNGGWRERTLYYVGNQDGTRSDVTFDANGNLYSTTFTGGLYDGGSVVQLTPSGGGWTADTLIQFSGGGGGSHPSGGVIFDRNGNIYGTTSKDGAQGGGIVFMLSPSNGTWNFSVIYNLVGSSGDYPCFLGGNYVFEPGPHDALVMDSAGNLYGTTYTDGVYQRGNVFKLSPASNGTWTYTSLYDFTGWDDGCNPVGGVALDASGNLYGTTLYGGTSGLGVAWKITP